MMGFLERLAGTDEHRGGLAYPEEWLQEAFTTTASYSGQTVSLEKAMTLTPFRSALMLISETVGGLPLKVYRSDRDGEKTTARDHRAWRMLHDMPNPVTPAHRFWSTIVTHLMLHGNAYIEKLRGPSGVVEELWPLEPREMIVEWNQNSRTKSFRLTSQPGEPTRRWTPESILHISGWSLNGLAGESILQYGRQTIGTALAREEFEGAFYKNGAVLQQVIEYPGQLNDTAVERLSAIFKARYVGSKNAHKTPVLEEGAKLNTIGSNLVDLDFEAAQQRSRTEIAVMFRLPPAFLAGTTGDSLTYATVESNMIQLVQHGIAPWTNTIESALSADRGIFPFASWFPEFVLEGLLRADSKARADFYESLARVNAITPNEIRARENMPPLPDGDVLSAVPVAANADDDDGET